MKAGKRRSATIDSKILGAKICIYFSYFTEQGDGSNSWQHGRWRQRQLIRIGCPTPSDLHANLIVNTASSSNTTEAAVTSIFLRTSRPEHTLAGTRTIHWAVFSSEDLTIPCQRDFKDHGGPGSLGPRTAHSMLLLIKASNHFKAFLLSPLLSSLLYLPNYLLSLPLNPGGTFHIRLHVSMRPWITIWRWRIIDFQTDLLFKVRSSC